MTNMTYHNWLLNHYRDQAVDLFEEDFVVNIIDDLVNRLRDHGIALNMGDYGFYECVHWSLHTQGAGASFLGRVDDWPKFLTAHGYTREDYPMFWRLVTHPAFEHDVGYGTVVRSYRHTHEYSVAGEWFNEINADFGLYIDPANAEDFAELIDEWTQSLEQEMDVLDTHFLTDFRDHMRWLHKQIEDGWDYATSDEYVSKWISANVTEAEIREQLKTRETA